MKFFKKQHGTIEKYTKESKEEYKTILIRSITRTEII
jgi:hypothetical protein